MDWKSLYRERLMSAEDAVRKIGPKSRIYTSHAAAAPTTLLQAMGDRYEWFDQVTLFNILLLGEAPFCKPEAAEHLRYQTIFTSAPTREAVNAGRADYIPASYSEVPSLVRGALRADVALLSVSPPDAHGFCSFGLTCDYQRAAAQTAGLVIAEVNRQMPRVHGDNMIAVEDIDCFVEVDRPLPQMAPAKIGEVERAIGAHCASLIHDGDTLQLGIGAIPDAVLLSLKDKKDLGIHSEMFSDGVVELMEAGVVTNKRKTLLPGVSVSTFLMGSDRLYRFVDDNPAVAL
ncbi:MAG: 4-hydroxybutyrate CoA-transferase, partial [Oscillospiraceae bacterium]